MDLESKSPPAGDPAAMEEEAWATVMSRWADDEAHREYLARFTDLDGLGRAGRRYRDALAERPEDPVALRWRDEVLKRATVQGLAQLPRVRRPRAAPPGLRRLLLAGLVLLAVALVGWLVSAISRLGRHS